MTKFIFVHDAEADNAPLLINIDDISYVTFDAETKKTLIRFRTDKMLCIVHESVDKVQKMIQDVTSNKVTQQ